MITAPTAASAIETPCPDRDLWRAACNQLAFAMPSLLLLTCNGPISSSECLSFPWAGLAAAHAHTTAMAYRNRIACTIWGLASGAPRQGRSATEWRFR